MPLLEFQARKPVIGKFWEPPPYEKVDDFIGALRRENVRVGLGTLEDEQLQCRMTGGVDYGNLLPYTGERTLHVETDSGKRDIDVQVLGAINGRGVAVLLDKTGEYLAL